MLSALDTLCPQALGANNPKRCGYVAQRGILIGLVFVVPIQVVLCSV